MWIVFVISLVIIALIVYVFIESSGFRTVTYNLCSDKMNDSNIKIAFLADLHNKDFGDNNRALIDAIDKFNPDIVCFSGDMITSGWDLNYDFSGTLKFIDKLSKKYPIYYSPGNHEERLDRIRDKFPKEYDELMFSINSFGVHYLDNIYEDLDNFPIRIYGLKLPHEYFDKYHKKELEDDLIDNVLGECVKNKMSILLAHDPRHFKKYSKWGADFVLSGHVHGGIVSLPFIGGIVAPGIKLFPKYDAGLFENNKSTLILTRGIGSHCMPIRINNKAEIVFINIKKEN